METPQKSERKDNPFLKYCDKEEEVIYSDDDPTKIEEIKYESGDYGIFFDIPDEKLETLAHYAVVNFLPSEYQEMLKRSLHTRINKGERPLEALGNVCFSALTISLLKTFIEQEEGEYLSDLGTTKAFFEEYWEDLYERSYEEYWEEDGTICLLVEYRRFYYWFEFSSSGEYLSHESIGLNDGTEYEK